MKLIDKLYVGILLTIFGGIVLHTPLTVGFGTLLPEYMTLLKAWKEVLMGVALLLLLIILATQKRWDIYKNHLIYLIAAFAIINILLIPLYFTGLEATIAGLLINLRYLLFFVLVYGAIRLYPELYGLFMKVFIAGAVVVTGFAVLQATVLPHDILKYIGYNDSTIAPFLTVDQNINYLRINSTLRGPNPLGAYAVIVLVVLLALWLRSRAKFSKPQVWLLSFAAIGSVIALWASYSRSAALAAIVAIGLVLLVEFGKKVNRGVWVGLTVLVLVTGGSLVALRDTTFVSQVILHEDPSEGGAVNSNDGHAESLIDGTRRMVQQPLGGGIGSTGSASLLTDSPVIIENQYLFIAHETGWLGLLVFLEIFIILLYLLWQRRRHWLSLGVFASGVGLAVIGLVLPVWVDDTVSIIWWGLAAIALNAPELLKKVPSKKLERAKKQ